MTEKTSKTKTPGSELFINRELSWCEFNHRVLEEAMDPSTPLLERFRFASIVSSNLDEFFMVRVAAQRHLKETGEVGKDPAGYTPAETLEALTARIHEMLKQLYTTIETELFPAARQYGITVEPFDTLTPEQRDRLKERFETEIFPILTPMAVDPAHPFPILNNLSLNIAVSLKPKGDEARKRLAVIPIPSLLPRFFQVPFEKNRFILLEEIIRNFLDRLFMGREIEEHVIFRITRDAAFEFDDEGSSDLLRSLETELRKRRISPVVRFEVEKNISEPLLKTFQRLLKITDDDVYINPLFLDTRSLSHFSDLAGFDSLRFPPFQPQIPLEFEGQERLWQMLRERDVVLQHPYESYEPVVQLVTQAANDPDVLAIKQTLYRTSGDSPIVRALASAAQSGKQVTVLVELMARFDEERNITWAKQLEKAGVHVIYGLVGLKTHAKSLLIVRREKDGIRRYVHLGTGNYNDKTAKLYTDFGLMTSDEAIGADASGFFNTITGYSDPPDFQKLTMAPLGLRERFLHLIHRETERAKSGQYSIIMAKMNSLVDQPIIEALYEASQAGVQIKLVVRGICCLRPGVKNISDRISVISIVDRFLEHSRLFYFSNGGDEEFYAASADWMPRNLDRRVELMFPITSEEGREKIRKTFEFLLSDNVKARVLNTDGTYQFRKRKKNEELLQAQEALYQYLTQQKDPTRPLLFKPVTTAPTGTAPLKR
jgi:polyphosphate kinase